MLKKLFQFGDMAFSRHIFHLFDQLFDMEISAFNEYLETCYFQTIQMKNVKHLDLKSKKPFLILTHTSCVIDEIFMKKHCHKPPKR